VNNTERSVKSVDVSELHSVNKVLFIWQHWCS